MSKRILITGSDGFIGKNLKVYFDTIHAEEVPIVNVNNPVPKIKMTEFFIFIALIIVIEVVAHHYFQRYDR